MLLFLLFKACIEPYDGFIFFVIFSAILNSFKLLTLDIELYKPECISPLLIFSSPYSKNVEETLQPLSIVGVLKSSRILSDSTPLPNE